MRHLRCKFPKYRTRGHAQAWVSSTVKDSSVVAVQVFDQRKFKRKDQGFLGVVNIKVTDVLDLELGGHGKPDCLLSCGV